MREIIQDLYTAQIALRKLPPHAPERLKLIRTLKERTPAPILAHFLRMVDQGQNGVSLVRHGVCSGCHIRVPSSSLPALVKPDDVHLCDHCGSYLLLPEEEIAQIAALRAARHRAVAV